MSPLLPSSVWTPGLALLNQAQCSMISLNQENLTVKCQKMSHTAPSNWNFLIACLKSREDFLGIWRRPIFWLLDGHHLLSAPSSPRLVSETGLTPKLSVILTFLMKRNSSLFVAMADVASSFGAFLVPGLWGNHRQLSGCRVVLEDLVWLSATPPKPQKLKQVASCHPQPWWPSW